MMAQAKDDADKGLHLKLNNLAYDSYRPKNDLRPSPLSELSFG